MIPSTSSRGGRAAALSPVVGVFCRLVMTSALLLGALSPLLPAVSYAEDDAGPASLKVHPEAARLNAEALIAEGKYRDAGRYLQTYLNGNPSDEEAWLLQASVFEHIKRYDLAERALTRAGEVRGVYLARARIAYRQDKFPEALAAVRKAIDRDPEYADAHHFLGYLLVTQKQYSEAAESLRTADEKETNKPAANAYYWGQALFNLKDYDAAETQFRRVAELNPESDYVKPAEDFLDLIGLRRDQEAKKNAAAAAPARKQPAKSSTPKKDWSAYAQLLVEYDTNVELLPDSTLPTPSTGYGDTAAFRVTLAGGGDYAFPVTRGAKVHLTGDFAGMYHFSDAAKDAQLLMLQGGSYADVESSIGVLKTTWSPFVLGRIVFFGNLGTPRDFPTVNAGSPVTVTPPDGTVDEFEFGLNDPFSVELEPGLRVALDHSDQARTGITLSYILSRFTDQRPGGGAPQSDRDAHTVRFSVSEAFATGLLGDNNLILTFRTRFGLRFADNEDYSYWAISPNLRAEWRPIEVVVVESSMQYRLEDHYKSPVVPASIQPGAIERTDDTINIMLGARYRLLKEDDFRLWLMGQYLYEVNLSTSDGTSTGTPPSASNDLEYDKHVISLGIRATF